jgi:hypothetical protein
MDQPGAEGPVCLYGRPGRRGACPAVPVRGPGSGTGPPPLFVSTGVPCTAQGNKSRACCPSQPVLLLYNRIKYSTTILLAWTTHYWSLYMMLASMYSCTPHVHATTLRAVQVSELSWLPGWSMSSWSASGGLGTAPALVPWHGMACTPCPPTRAHAMQKRSMRREPRKPGCVRACRGPASCWIIEIETTRPWKSLASTR